MELVTGHQGSDHVTSAQARALNSAIFGRKNFVTEYKNMFDFSTVAVGRLFKVGSGAAVMSDGGFVVSDEEESISLGSVASNESKICIVGIKRYTEDGLELAKLDVVSGNVSTNGNPVPPDISAISVSFMPLYRATVTGSGIENVVKMFDVYGSASGADAPVEINLTDDDGKWSYVKWSSGRLECWTVKKFGWGVQHLVGRAWGNLYVSNFEIKPDDYPIAFVERPNVTASLDNYDYAGFLVGAVDAPSGIEGTQASETTPGGYRMARATSAVVHGGVCINAVGRWK